MRPGAFYPLIGCRPAAQQFPLIGPGNRHGLLQKAVIVGAQGFIGDSGGVFGNDGPLPLRVKDGFAAVRLAARHHCHRTHAALKQFGHLRVDGVDLRAGLLQKFHGSFLR